MARGRDPRPSSWAIETPYPTHFSVHQVLRACGFCQDQESIHLPPDADLAPLRCCLSRCSRLLARRGHTGSAKEARDAAPAQIGLSPVC